MVKWIPVAMWEIWFLNSIGSWYVIHVWKENHAGSLNKSMNKPALVGTGPQENFLNYHMYGWWVDFHIHKFFALWTFIIVSMSSHFRIQGFWMELLRARTVLWCRWVVCCTMRLWNQFSALWRSWTCLCRKSPQQKRWESQRFPFICS